MLCLLLVSLVVSGGGSPQTTSPAKQVDIPLPSLADYASLALSADGAVWVTDSFGSITRVDATGRRTEYRIGGDQFPGDIVAGPDGAMWFTADTIGRIDRTGSVTFSQPSAPSLSQAITAMDDGLWYTNQARDRIERINTDGSVTASIRVDLPSGVWAMPGIATGPDGALWFTESAWGADDQRDAIGRVTPEGVYSTWSLPTRRADPRRITAGPDGALWFTEQLGNRIGRITTSGVITEFPLPSGLSPSDITRGTDGALWFTTDTCLGRMTTKGQLILWPLTGARQQVGIAAAPDGSLWILDRIGHALRHFTPPSPVAAPAQECDPPSVAAQEGATRARLIYKRVDYDKSYGDFFTEARIRISRRGKEVFSEVIPPHAKGYPEYPVFGSTRSFAVRDLDRDGEPEVMLRLGWNGTHCCEWSRIYRFEASRGTYVSMTHFWGNSFASPNLQDVDDDGRPEFVSKDDRFADLTGYASVVAPIQLWSYDHGKFSDVTRRYPDAIEADAARHWGYYQKNRGKGTVRYVLIAWAADEYMLGRAATVDQTLEEARTAGYLDPKTGDSGDPDAYIRRLEAFLRHTGYIRGA